MKKIIVLEDTSKHVRDAYNFFNTQEDLRVFHVKDFKEFEEFLGDDGVGGEWRRIDGIISDIHFPYSKESIGYDSPQPIGAMILVLARERKIPCVLISDKGHHSTDNQWVCVLQRALGMPAIIDDVNEEGSKNWEKALLVLRSKMSD